MKKAKGIEISVKPLPKSKVETMLASPSTRAGAAFRKTLPGKAKK